MGYHLGDPIHPTPEHIARLKPPGLAQCLQGLGDLHLGHRRLEWKCDAANARSMRAAERFGFSAEGLFRQHRVRKGRNRDTAWFAMIDGDWPALRDSFQRWLAVDNFNADGQQKQRLEELR